MQPRFIVAIIGLESDYGTYPIDEPLFDVVATLAFDGRRGAQFRAQLLAALEIVDKGYATPDEMKSSWAGALGVPQFTPTNVLEIAVDHDKDGRIDLWNVGPDVIASVAHYLQQDGLARRPDVGPRGGVAGRRRRDARGADGRRRDAARASAAATRAWARSAGFATGRRSACAAPTAATCRRATCRRRSSSATAATIAAGSFTAISAR